MERMNDLGKVPKRRNKVDEKGTQKTLKRKAVKQSEFRAHLYPLRKMKL
jgi:hypothetical protein